MEPLLNRMKLIDESPLYWRKYPFESFFIFYNNHYYTVGILPLTVNVLWGFCKYLKRLENDIYMDPWVTFLPHRSEWLKLVWWMHLVNGFFAAMCGFATSNQRWIITPSLGYSSASFSQNSFAVISRYSGECRRKYFSRDRESRVLFSLLRWGRRVQSFFCTFHISGCSS